MNKYIEFTHFTMSTIEMIEANCFMNSISLKNAHFIVKFDPKFQCYLKFKWMENINSRVFQMDPDHVQENLPK